MDYCVQEQLYDCWSKEGEYGTRTFYQKKNYQWNHTSEMFLKESCYVAICNPAVPILTRTTTLPIPNLGAHAFIQQTFIYQLDFWYSILMRWWGPYQANLLEKAGFKCIWGGMYRIWRLTDVKGQKEFWGFKREYIHDSHTTIKWTPAKDFS